MRELTLPEILGLQSVRRWHTRRAIPAQTVADHSAVVALLALKIGGSALTPDQRLEVVLLGLLHDAHEAQWGDIPFPARQALLLRGIDLEAITQEAFWGPDGFDRDVSPLVRDLVAVADRLEAAFHAMPFASATATEIARDAQALAQARLQGEPYRRALELIQEVL